MSEPEYAMTVDIETRYYTGRVYIYMTGYHYELTQPAMFIAPEGSQEQLFVASVMIEDGKLPNNQSLYLKGWSENEGLPDSLVEAGVVAGPVQSVSLFYPTHEVQIGVYTMNDTCLKAWEVFKGKVLN